MSALYILGNGFDLAHKLPTKYSDFRCWLCKNEKDKPSLKDELDAMFSLSENWSNFEEALSAPDSKEEKTYDRLGLVDIFKSNLSEKFKEWVKNVNSSFDCDRVFNCFSTNDYYLTFNYTSLLESSVYNVNDKICHIHGYDIETLFDSSSELMFGHNVEKPNSKLAKLLYKDTEKNFSKHIDFFNCLNNVERIIVIGYSYSLIDKYYFMKILERRPDIEWLLGYYNEIDKKNCEFFAKTLSIKKYNIVNIELLK